MSSDWQTKEVVLTKRTTAKDRKTNTAINQAQRSGNLNVEKKYGGGSNQQKSIQKNTAKLDAETEELKHEKVSKDFCTTLREARAAKGMTQKELAQSNGVIPRVTRCPKTYEVKINEKPNVVAEYESGKAIPNNQVQSKMERALGVRLRGKDAGKPLQPRGKQK